MLETPFAQLGFRKHLATQANDYFVEVSVTFLKNIIEKDVFQEDFAPYELYKALVQSMTMSFMNFREP